MNLITHIIRQMDFSADKFRLGQQGFVLDDEGFVECQTCGPHNCGQCGNGNRVGLHIMEYKERFWK